MPPTLTPAQIKLNAFLAAVDEADTEAQRLACQVHALAGTDPKDTQEMRRRANATLAVGRRLAELLVTLEASKP